MCVKEHERYYPTPPPPSRSYLACGGKQDQSLVAVRTFKNLTAANDWFWRVLLPQVIESHCCKWRLNPTFLTLLSFSFMRWERMTKNIVLVCQQVLTHLDQFSLAYNIVALNFGWCCLKFCWIIDAAVGPTWNKEVVCNSKRFDHFLPIDC